MNFKNNNFKTPSLILLIHSLSLILFSIISTFSYLLIYSPFFDITTYLFSMVFFLILFITAICAHKFKIRILDYILFVFYLYCVPRMLQYALDPSNIYFPHNLGANGLSIIDINNGFASLLICLLFFFSSIILIYAYLNNKKYTFFKINLKKKDSSFPNYLLFITLICFILITYLEYIIYSNPENSILVIGRYEKSKIDMYLKIFLTLFSSDIFMYFILFMLILNKDLQKKVLLNKKTILISSLLVISYCYVGALMGSRGVGLRIILIVLAILIISPLNLKNFKYSSLIIILSLVASVTMLFIAQKTRYELHLKSEFTVKSACPGCFVSDKNVSNINKGYVWLLNRMNYFDYFIISLSKDPKKTCKEKYLNFVYYYKNTINFLMPGDPYPEAIISSATVFGLCYRPEIYAATDEKGLTNFDKGTYTSQVWSLFGLSRIHAGDWMYLYIILFSSLIGFISFFLSHWNNLPGKILYSYFVYSTPFIFIFSMGIDHSIMSSIVIILRWLAFGLSLYLIGKIRFFLKSCYNLLN